MDEAVLSVWFATLVRGVTRLNRLTWVDDVLLFERSPLLRCPRVLQLRCGVRESAGTIRGDLGD